jgi:hypothetical protein
MRAPPGRAGADRCARHRAELESFEAAPRAELELTDARATGLSWTRR